MVIGRDDAFCGRCGSLRQGGPDGTCPKCIQPKKPMMQKPLEQMIKDELGGNKKTHEMLQYLAEQIKTNSSDLMSKLPGWYKDAAAKFIKSELIFQDGKKIAEAAAHPYLLATELDEIESNEYYLHRGLDLFASKKENSEKHYFKVLYYLILSANPEIAPGQYYIAISRKDYIGVDNLKKTIKAIEEKIAAETDFGKREFEINFNAKKTKALAKLEVQEPKNPLARFVLIPSDFGL